MHKAQIRTKRWDDPAEPDDGFRLLICRYRPRGLLKELETWHEWWPALGPSTALHAAVYGKRGVSISWGFYRRRYLAEMKNAESRRLISDLAARIRAGETVTLLCSSACERESRCHRSLLREILEAQLVQAEGTG